MSQNIMILMISVSTLLGALALFALIWAVKTGQFDDEKKFLNSVHFDNEEDLRDAINLEEKRKEQKRKKEYRPAD